MIKKLSKNVLLRIKYNVVKSQLMTKIKASIIYYLCTYNLANISIYTYSQKEPPVYQLASIDTLNKFREFCQRLAKVINSSNQKLVHSISKCCVYFINIKHNPFSYYQHSADSKQFATVSARRSLPKTGEQQQKPNPSTDTCVRI